MKYSHCSIFSQDFKPIQDLVLVICKIHYHRVIQHIGDAKGKVLGSGSFDLASFFSSSKMSVLLKCLSCKFHNDRIKINSAKPTA